MTDKKDNLENGVEDIKESEKVVEEPATDTKAEDTKESEKVVEETATDTKAEDNKESEKVEEPATDSKSEDTKESEKVVEEPATDSKAEDTKEFERVVEEPVITKDEEDIKYLNEKEKYNKKDIIIGIICVAVIVVSGYFLVNTIIPKTTDKDLIEIQNKASTDFSKDIDEISDEDLNIEKYNALLDTNIGNFNKVDLEGFTELLNNGTASFIYIGRPTCEDCQEFLPLLVNVLNKEGIQINYFDTDSAKGNSNTKNKIGKVLNSISVEQVPTIIKVTGKNIETLSAEGYSNANILSNFLLEK